MPNQTKVSYPDHLDKYHNTITVTLYHQGQPERKSIAAEFLNRLLFAQKFREFLPSLLIIIAVESTVIATIYGLREAGIVHEHIFDFIVLMSMLLALFLPSPRKVVTWEKEVISFKISTRDTHWSIRNRCEYHIDLPRENALRMVKNVVESNYSAIDSAVELAYSVQRERGGECLHDELEELLKTIFDTQETVGYDGSQAVEDSAREQIRALSDAYRNIAELTKEINNNNQ